MLADEKEAAIDIEEQLGLVASPSQKRSDSGTHRKAQMTPTTMKRE